MVGLADQLLIARLLDYVEDVGDGHLVLDDLLLQGPVLPLHLRPLYQQALLALPQRLQLLLQLLQLDPALEGSRVHLPLQGSRGLGSVQLLLQPLYLVLVGLYLCALRLLPMLAHLPDQAVLLLQQSLQGLYLSVEVLLLDDLSVGVYLQALVLALQLEHADCQRLLFLVVELLRLF